MESYYFRNRDKILQKVKKYREENKQAVLEKQAIWYERNKNSIKNRLLQRDFGITIEEYNKMFADQSGKCAICGREETMKLRGKTKALSVDHNHETGQIRGLLCTHCNRGLGCFKDNTSLLGSALEYLEKYNDG